MKQSTPTTIYNHAVDPFIIYIPTTGITRLTSQTASDSLNIMKSVLNVLSNSMLILKSMFSRVPGAVLSKFPLASMQTYYGPEPMYGIPVEPVQPWYLQTPYLIILLSLIPLTCIVILIVGIIIYMRTRTATPSTPASENTPHT